MKTSTLADDTEKLSNLINTQPGIGPRKCILLHDETLGRWVGVWMNKWLCNGGRVNKWMNEYHQLRTPDWKEKSLLYSDVKKTGKNLQFKYYPKVYHMKTFMWKHSQIHSLFLKKRNFPKTAGNWRQGNRVRGTALSVSQTWRGSNQHPSSCRNSTLLLETARALETWELKRFEHLIDDDLQCVPLAFSGHKILRAGLRISLC